ncbi:hypothetical protein MRX96_000463 [Rhipicephalus microplus]
MPRCFIGIPEGLAMAFHPQLRDVKGSGATRHRLPLPKATTTGLHDFLALRNTAGPSGSVLQISLLAHRCFFSPGMTGRLPLTTSQIAVAGNNQEVAPAILTMHEVEESSHRIRLHAPSSRRWRKVSQLVQGVVPVDAYPTKALKPLPTT